MRIITQADWILFIVLWIIIIVSIFIRWRFNEWFKSRETAELFLFVIIGMSIVSILSFIPYHYLLAPINETIKTNVTWW